MTYVPPPSGKSGKVTVGSTDLVDLKDWTLDDMSELHPYASNSTAGRRRRVVGHGDSKGTITYRPDGNLTTNPLASGTTYTLHLYEDGASKTDVMGVIGKISKKVDVDSGAIIEYVADWEENFQTGGTAFTPH